MFDISEVIKEFVPVLRKLAAGRYAISIAGSIGKKVQDEKSDIDFRLFYENRIESQEEFNALRAEFKDKAKCFGEKNIKVDDFWPRKIEDIDNMLDIWFEGGGKPIDFEWTIWGYYPLTDIHNQYIIEDEWGIISRWHQRLETYPQKLKDNIIAENLGTLKYWRKDYHLKAKSKERILSL